MTIAHGACTVCESVCKKGCSKWEGVLVNLGKGQMLGVGKSEQMGCGLLKVVAL